MSQNNKPYDIAIAGAGAVGLWLACKLAAEDISVILLDENASRSAASNGMLGALLPHMPTGWNAKKQFQFEALVALPEEIARLEAQGGMTTGYKQCGRIMPIRRPGFLRQTKAFADKYKEVWHRQGKLVARYEHAEIASFRPWLNVQQAPLGVAHETFSARINPRLLVAALRRSIAGKVDVRDDFSLHHYDVTSRKLYGKRKSGEQQEIRAEKLVIAAGYKSYRLLSAFLSPPPGRTYETDAFGTGIKGQVALLKTDAAIDQMPILYDNGLYVVPHNNNSCAVGSTAEKSWQHPQTTDHQIDDLVHRARALCPALHQATVEEKWAGIRPRCHAKDPLIGKLPGQPIYIATGGFKITLGIAHKMAEILVEMLGQTSGTASSLPPSFTMDYHLQEAEERFKHETL